MPSSAVDFFRLRWYGEVPMRRLFWSDMLLIGTLINLTASVAALALVAGGAPAWLAVALHFAPVPYNLFLLLAVGRSPERGTGIELLAGLWFVAMLLV
ncbi:MAG: hypothetical protein ACK5PG_09625 [Lysobacterales bacterium]|jgi:hypothetical protein